MATQHAKTRPPSAADRWENCPESAHVVTMYPNDETDASKKGDYWHEVMEDTVTFGAVPPQAEPDVTEAMEDLLAYVTRRIEEMGGRGNVQVYVETQIDIPATGEFGTADIILVSPEEIEIIDEKSGYVPVKVERNSQMFNYLDGAIALHGARRKYTVTIHQPNYDHVDGHLRSYVASEDDLRDWRERVAWSIANEGALIAGPHCKKTYCPHRGACEAFRVYAKDDLSLGWHTSEYKTMTDSALSVALDASDELAGYRNELRSEAMRRIMNMDRTVHGYKVVKGRKQRTVINPRELVDSVLGNMGVDWAAKLFPDLGWATSDLYGVLTKHTGVMTEELLKCLGTPKHIEDVVKQYAKTAKLPRGAWQGVYDTVVGAYIRETASGLTLEKAID